MERVLRALGFTVLIFSIILGGICLILGILAVAASSFPNWLKCTIDGTMFFIFVFIMRYLEIGD